MWLEHHKKTFRLPKLLQSLSLFKSQEGRIKKLKSLISKIWNERFQSFYRWWLSLESQFASWERPYSSKLKNCAFIRILFSKVILQVFDKMTCVSRTFSRWKSKFAKLWKTIFWTTTSFVQGDQDHFFTKEMLISPSLLKLHKNPWIWEGLRTIHFI